jgi:hypothetical protein
MKKSNTSKKQGTDYERLDAMTDDDIDFSEILPITDEMFARGVARPPRSVTEPREQLTVTLDRDLAKCTCRKSRVNLHAQRLDARNEFLYNAPIMISWQSLTKLVLTVPLLRRA